MTATATPMIYAALAAAAKEIGAVGKDKQNVQQNYKFRGIDAVVNAVHPVFTKHGIVTALKVVDQKREERQTKNGGTLLTSLLMCEITFYATDGSNVVCGALGEGMDSGDKASNKAMSAALKYALTQTLMIPFEVHDSEDDNPEPAARSPQPRPQERPAPPPVENGPADNRAGTGTRKAAGIYKCPHEIDGTDLVGVVPNLVVGDPERQVIIGLKGGRQLKSAFLLTEAEEGQFFDCLRFRWEGKDKPHSDPKREEQRKRFYDKNTQEMLAELAAVLEARCQREKLEQGADGYVPIHPPGPDGKGPF